MERVPPEILTDILKYGMASWLGSIGGAPESREDQSSYALVSRKWKELAQPIQWRDLSVHFVPDEENNPSAYHREFGDALAFLSGISLGIQIERRVSIADTINFLQTHPHLAQYIRRLRLAPIHAVNGVEVEARITPQQLASILAQLPNIKALNLAEIAIDVRSRSEVQHIVVPKLDLLWLDYGIDTNFHPRTMLGALSLFSDVKQCVIDVFAYDPTHIIPQHVDLVQCRIESLHLRFRGALSYMLTNCWNPMITPGILHTLELGVIAPLDTKLIGEAVTQFAPSLKRLLLSVDVLNFNSDDYMTGEHNFAFLSTCSQVQDLRINLEFDISLRSDRSGWILLHHMLTHLVPSARQLRTLRLEFNLGGNPRTIHPSLSACPRRHDIEALLLRLPSLEYVSFDGVPHNGMRLSADDVNVVPGLLPEVHSRGVLRFGDGEDIDDLTLVQEMYQDVAKWR